MSRLGVTLIEMVIAFALFGILMALATPRLREWHTRESARSARREVTAHLARTRTAAVQRGCPTVLHLDPATSRVWVTGCQVLGSETDTLGAIDNLSDRFGVTFESDSESLLFTPHGVATASSWTRVTFSKKGYSTGLVVTPVGRAVW